MKKPVYILMACMALLWSGSPTTAQEKRPDSRQIIDAAGRNITIPGTIQRIICSGPGALRLVTYLKAQDLVVGVDDIETRLQQFDARPYSLANPQFKTLPVFGGFRGHDNPEKILGLDPLPQVILKTFATMGYDPIKLEQKTNIPVITLEYGDLLENRQKFYTTLTLLGHVLHREERAQAVIDFFEAQIADLEGRTRDLGQDQIKTCFVGGIAFKGPHGFQSTEPGYPPFFFVNARNIARNTQGQNPGHTIFSKETLLRENPEVLFLDLSTLQMGTEQGGWHELKNDPIYRGLSGVVNQKIHGLLPYNWYTQNFGSILANAWFIGKTLYPERFEDIIPEQTADRIYSFLVGAKVFSRMNQSFNQMVFQPLDLR